MAQGRIRYRCFLPDLTGFTVPPCTGPNYQQSTSNFALSPETSSKLASTNSTMIGRKNQDCSFDGHSESQFIYFLNLKLLAQTLTFLPALYSRRQIA